MLANIRSVLSLLRNEIRLRDSHINALSARAMTSALLSASNSFTPPPEGRRTEREMMLLWNELYETRREFAIDLLHSRGGAGIASAGGGVYLAPERVASIRRVAREVYEAAARVNAAMRAKEWRDSEGFFEFVAAADILVADVLEGLTRVVGCRFYLTTAE
jgi:hypothetical protein